MIPSIRLSLITICVLTMPLLGGRAPLAAELKTENVVLVTPDGLRTQELFGGVDSVIFENKEKSGVRNKAKLKRTFWRKNPARRREVLLPFFWGKLAGDGIVLGNPALGSNVRVTNGNFISYPGYAEMLTGAPVPNIKTNIPIRIGRTTVFEYIQEQRGFSSTEVAAFCSWGLFDLIVSHEKAPFFRTAGHMEMDPKLITQGMAPYVAIQSEALTPWDSVRFDTVTLNLALEYLEHHRPRLLYVSFDETDDWAHDRRYDRVVQSAHFFDKGLERLWNKLQSIDQYRDKTTMIVTTDHGRGLTGEDWTSHDKTIPGSEDIWIGIIGPDTPSGGELRDTGELTQGQIATTIAKFFDLDYQAYYPDAAPPIAQAFRAPAAIPASALAAE